MRIVVPIKLLCLVVDLQNNFYIGGQSNLADKQKTFLKELLFAYTSQKLFFSWM